MVIDYLNSQFEDNQQRKYPENYVILFQVIYCRPYVAVFLIMLSLFTKQVDVAGTLYFWDVTIDTASSILLTLCVGLAVDYSAHVAHMFMTVQGTKDGIYFYVPSRMWA